MKILIILGVLATVVSYFISGITASAFWAMIVAATVLSYLVARKTSLARAMLFVAFILSFAVGGFVGKSLGPKAHEAVFFVIGGTIGIGLWLLMILSVLFLCSEIIFVTDGGDRWGSFIYLINSMLFERAGDFQIVEKGEVRTIKPRGIFAPFKAIGYVFVNHGNAVVLERFGQCSRVLPRGFFVRRPFEVIRAAVDLRRQIENRTETFYTKDGIPLTVNVGVAFQIDTGEGAPTSGDMFPFSEQAVLKAVYVVPDWKAHTIGSAISLLRGMISSSYMDEIYDPLKRRKGVDTHIHLFEERLQEVLSQAASTWGVKIHGVKLHVEAPEEIEEQALAFEKARREEQIELQKARAENRRIKEFVARTGGSVTDYAILRYLEKIGEAGIVPPTLERMILDAIQKGTIGPSAKKETEAGEKKETD